MKLVKGIAIALGIVVSLGISIVGLVYALESSIKTTEMNTALDIATARDVKSTNNTTIITEEEAKTIVLNRVPGSKIVDIGIEEDDGILKYDAKLVDGNIEYEIDLDAQTGKIVEFEKDIIKTNENNSTANQVLNSSNDNNSSKEKQTNSSKSQSKTSTTQSSSKKTSTKKSSSSLIGKTKAKQIMLNKVPGARLIKIELDKDDGRYEYEGELVKGNTEYEITVDALTGKIIDFDKEYDESKSSSNKKNNKYSNYKYYDDDDDDDRYDDDDDEDDDDDDRYDDDDDD